MPILGGFDLHRSQITYDLIDISTGEVERGRIVPATRGRLASWLERFDGGDAAIALEATTGWRFVVDELEAAGVTAHLADPAETAHLRGRKRRAKTDRTDARHLRTLLTHGRVPRCWIPPAHIVDLRSLVRLRKTLSDDHTAWIQRIHAQLFHHGVARPDGWLLKKGNRSRIQAAPLPASARRVVAVGLATIDHLDAQLGPIDDELGWWARHQAGCRALMSVFGIGVLTATAIVAELGDTRRFSSSRLAVRYAGLDVTVYESNDKRSPGVLSKQGPEVLRWALYEAAKCASRTSSPEHAYYRDVRARCGAGQATLSVARKLCRQAHHILGTLGAAALAPPTEPRRAIAA
jgi:transposase